jgi:DNA polymerase-3 subunit chi
MRVDFYLLQSGSTEAQLQLTCRLCAKTYASGQRAHVVTPDPDTAARLDSLLWHFDDQSFIPHGRIGEPEAEGAPITIGPPESAPETDILLNLDTEIPTTTSCQRVLEVVPADESSRQAARVRYKQYRDLNADLNTHEI